MWRLCHCYASQVAETLKSKNDITNLRETFTVLEKYNMKMNLTKYAF